VRRPDAVITLFAFYLGWKLLSGSNYQGSFLFPPLWLLFLPAKALLQLLMYTTSVNDYLRQHIRTVPNWPAPGVQFRDITPLLQDPKVFRVLIDAFVHRYMDADKRPDVVAGLDARGFILGAVIAYELNVGFVPIRKKGQAAFHHRRRNL
jgi:Adenine/guanine phosphoribosyltransferases and related PRPP-binding proteins